MTNAPAYAVLSDRFARAAKLAATRNLLFWDSQTGMPKAAAASRGEQSAALQEACHDLIVAPDAPDLLSRAEHSASGLSPAEAANLAEMRRIHRNRAAVPAALDAEKARLSATLLPAWVAAKEQSDFALFAPGFVEMLAINRQIAAARADALGHDPYGAMVEENDPGITTALIDPIFHDLAASLPALLQAAIERQAGWPAPVPLDGDFSAPRQQALAERLAATVGLGPDICRIDQAPHPFALIGTPGDARFTTAFDPDNPCFNSDSVLHEAGHALYEQGLPRDLAFNPAGVARGLTVHESQSLTIEMLIGRSREWLSWLAPAMRDAFGGSAAAWAPENLVNIQRRVGVSDIRIEADELSYPLHVILRYRIERALLSGDLAVADLPGAWNDLSEQLLGRRPPNDARGCLQDIHWAIGHLGYFPNYALGLCLAAQLFERAQADDPAILPSLAQGDFAPYRAWVHPRVHQRASLLPFADLVMEATGAALSADALKRHLAGRYLAEAGPGAG
jgi:carboxypeptidase Taq